MKGMPEAGASGFLFSFDQDLHVDGKLAEGFLQGFERFQVDVDLAFVVGGTAPKEIAVPHGGLECRRGPEIEGFGRLDIVVPVEKDSWLARRFQVFRVDERVGTRRNDLNAFESSGAEVYCHPSRSG